MAIETAVQRVGVALEKEIECMLVDISKNYKLDIQELKARYMPVIEPAQVPVPKKRGRKKKQKEEYIEAEEYEYEGDTFLVDDKNTVYTNNIDAPRIVGERLVDGTIHFYARD